MSMGYEGYMLLDTQDDEQVVYKYACGNLNEELDEYHLKIANPDGIIAIDKDCFTEPEIHRKRKRTRSGRKKMVEKRIIQSFEYGSHIENGKITIKNASGCWRVIDGNDFMALHLLYKLFREYQEIGCIPQKVSIFW